MFPVVAFAPSPLQRLPPSEKVSVGGEGVYSSPIKANSHIICRAHAVSRRVEIVSFPFDSQSAAVFDSHIPCHVHAAPLPCSNHTVLKATSQGHGTSRHGHGMVCVRIRL